MIKFSTGLPFCTCFYPAWTAEKQQGSCDWLKLGRWYAVIGHTPTDVHCSIWIKLQYWHTIFTMLHTSFKLETSLKVIYCLNGFLEKKNCVNTRPSSDFSRCHTESPSQFLCAIRTDGRTKHPKSCVSATKKCLSHFWGRKQNQKTKNEKVYLGV